MTQKLITRFAPSPTGYLHIGGLRTAFYNYLYARKHGGKFLLRIEDTDLKRNSKEASKAIIEAFKWCGLDYDDEPIYQSQRFDLYKFYIQKLLDENKAYYCYMSKEELEILRTEQERSKQRPRYDGRYRNFKGIAPEGIEPVVRIKAPQSGEIIFKDGIKGEVKFRVEDILDDFIIARSDGTATYNFTVVVDDALMGVSDIIRGDDHLSNTPKQIVLYEALGFTIPHFYHVAMIHGQDGKKLSKRHGAMDVMEYKAMGILPQALLNFLVRLGWSHGDDELFSLEELKKLFDPKHINKSASCYDFKKLQWLNSHYIKNLCFDEINAQLRDLGLDLSAYERSHFLLDLLKERSKNLIELISAAKSIINTPQDYDKNVIDKFINENNLLLLKNYAHGLSFEKSAQDFEEFTQNFLDKHGAKLKDLAQAIRIALTANTVSPSIFELLEFLGINESKSRISKFLEFMKRMKFKEECLKYHIGGKIDITSSKPMNTSNDLCLAYSPGVAYACLEIVCNEELAYTYTNKANLVAIVSDGSAVLGLGNIGAKASKPVMEGKACLFKKFANINAYDLEINVHSVEEIVAFCRALAPGVGGINLEDIAAPKCFDIELALQDLGIPVMHDDQHGTAIISAAALINAMELSAKKFEDIKVVISGSGAAGIASARMYRQLGVQNIILVDSKGVVCKHRDDLSPQKLEFAINSKEKTLREVLRGADVFLGLSAPKILSDDMILSMAKNPVIFALANPIPEVMPEDVIKLRKDAIIGTGRSDYPNQINNVLGFPFIFRGALDVRANKITENMKIAAARALADLAKLPVSKAVKNAYNVSHLEFGRDYIIPKPFDERIRAVVSTAVACAALKDGVARIKNFDASSYFESLKSLEDERYL